jgi:hypothetical protein
LDRAEFAVIKYNGHDAPAQMPVTIEDRKALVGQYIRHRNSDEIFKITEIGRDGVIAYQAEGFGGPTGGDKYLITWNSLKYKHLIMVHVADIDTKPGELH